MNLATKVIDDPEDQAEGDTEEDAGSKREIEGAVIAAMDYVSGKAAEAEGKLAAEVEKRACGD